MTTPSAQLADPLAEERARLRALEPGFSSHAGFNARMIDYCFRSVRPWVDGAGRCVELGCSDGRMTAKLLGCVEHLTAVDGSPAYTDAVQAALPTVEVVHAMFEEFTSAQPFDVAVLGHVLEHVEDPVLILQRARCLVRRGGRVIVTVPNADSLHRQVGVAMGMLEHRQALNEGDLRIGHRRVYTSDELLGDVAVAGLRPIHAGGIFLKPLSDAQMERDWSPELVDAYYELGKAHPDLCANLLVVAER